MVQPGGNLIFLGTQALLNLGDGAFLLLLFAIKIKNFNQSNQTMEGFLLKNVSNQFLNNVTKEKQAGESSLNRSTDKDEKTAEK